MSEEKILKENVDVRDIVNMLNKFEDKRLFNEKDMYHSGEWLYGDVDYNNEIVKKELDAIILNIEEYRLENNKGYAHSEDKNIVGLNHLVDHCREKLGMGIKYFNPIHDGVDEEDVDGNISEETYFYTE